MAKAPSVYRSKNFVKLWVSQVVSKAGANFVEVGLAVFAMSVAHGDLAAYGGIIFAGMIPAVLLGWAVGGVADRWDRKRTMVSGDIIRALLVLSVPVVNQLWWAYGAVFLVETVGLVYKPGVRAMTPDTVGEGQVMAAGSALSVGQSIVDIPVYLLVGVIVARAGSASPFLIDATAFVVAGATLATLALPAQVAAGRARATSFWSDLRDGVAFHLQTPVVGRLLVLSMVGVIGVAGVNVASAAVIQHLLGRPEGDLGWLLAGIAAGMWVGSSLMGRLGDDHRRYSVFIALGLLGFGLETAGVAWSRDLFVTIGLYLVGGFCNAVYQLPIRAWLQTTVPREMRGRVFAARGMGIGSTAAVAALLTGWVVNLWTLPVTLVVLAAFAVAAAGLAVFWLARAARAASGGVAAAPAPSRIGG
ncbi:MAG: MFS transporter [Thermaerobacter sp.]|nr:MFS transporter [Thermaerobacter sp.]